MQLLSEVELAGAELVEVGYKVASHMPFVVKVLDVVETLLVDEVLLDVEMAVVWSQWLEVEVVLVVEMAVPEAARALARMIARIENFILAVVEGVRTESRGRESDEKGRPSGSDQCCRCLNMSALRQHSVHMPAGPDHTPISSGSLCSSAWLLRRYLGMRQGQARVKPSVGCCLVLRGCDTMDQN